MKILNILLIVTIILSTAEESNTTAFYEKFIPITFKQFFQGKDGSSNSQVQPKTTHPTSEEGLTVVERVEYSGKIAYNKLVPIPIKRVLKSEETKMNSHSKLNPKINRSVEGSVTLIGKVMSSSKTIYDKLVPRPIKRLFENEEIKSDTQIQPQSKISIDMEGNFTVTEKDSNDQELYDKIILSPSRRLFGIEETLIERVKNSGKGIYDKIVPSPIKRLFGNEETKSDSQTQSQSESNTQENLTLIERVKNGGKGIYDKIVPTQIKRLFGSEETENDSQMQSQSETNTEDNLTFIERVKNGSKDIYDKIVPTPIRRLFGLEETNNDSQMKSRSETNTEDNFTFIERVKNGSKDIYDKIVPIPIRRLFGSEEAKRDSQTEDAVETNLTLWEKVKNSSKNIYEKYVPSTIKHAFHKENDDSTTLSGKNNVAKEHGHLDFFGRDFVKSVGKTIGKIENKFTSSSKGLDSDKGFFQGVIHGFKEKVRAIFPGTLWCGDGNKAHDEKELGLFYLTDDCCREHDNCRDFMGAGEIRSGLENTGLFTRSHCACDEKFHSCLKKADSIISNKIGYTYFTVLGPQCFKIDYPIIKCKKMDRKRCVEYVYDETNEKHEQWFDNPAY